MFSSYVENRIRNCTEISVKDISVKIKRELDTLSDIKIGDRIKVDSAYHFHFWKGGFLCYKVAENFGDSGAQVVKSIKRRVSLNHKKSSGELYCMIGPLSRQDCKS